MPQLRARAAEAAAKGGGFVTIWRGNRILWKGPEDEIPPRFREGAPDES
ncbi:MAG: hypothetical protein WA975_19110 [Mesorhizobium sp.]